VGNAVRRWRPLFTVAVLLAACPAFAQIEQARLNGTVFDAQGGVLPGVTVTATQTDTGLVRTTVSNETGSYSLPNLPLGPYRLEATLSGFRTFAQTGIVLQVNSSPVVNPVLSVDRSPNRYRSPARRNWSTRERAASAPWSKVSASSSSRSTRARSPS